MKYSKPFGFFLLIFGLFSLTMNFKLENAESQRTPSSVQSSENGHGANISPPWWMTY